MSHLPTFNTINRPAYDGMVTTTANKFKDSSETAETTALPVPLPPRRLVDISFGTTKLPGRTLVAHRAATVAASRAARGVFFEFYEVNGRWIVLLKDRDTDTGLRPQRVSYARASAQALEGRTDRTFANKSVREKGFCNRVARSESTPARNRG